MLLTYHICGDYVFCVSEYQSMVVTLLLSFCEIRDKRGSRGGNEEQMMMILIVIMIMIMM